MKEFKVNVSKDALEAYYGRELTGQEIETARGVTSEIIGGIRVIDKPYFFYSANSLHWNTNMDGFHENAFPERPLSDFLPAVERRKDGFVSGVFCADCRYFEGDCPVENASPWSKHRQFCADFESQHTGLGVRETILNSQKTQDVDLDVRCIPNCARCEWSVPSLWRENIALKTMGCTAQGVKECRDCYNTPECKALYQEKE